MENKKSSDMVGESTLKHLDYYSHANRLISQDVYDKLAKSVSNWTLEEFLKELMSKTIEGETLSENIEQSQETEIEKRIIIYRTLKGF